MAQVVAQQTRSGSLRSGRDGDRVGGNQIQSAGGSSVRPRGRDRDQGGAQATRQSSADDSGSAVEAYSRRQSGLRIARGRIVRRDLVVNDCPSGSAKTRGTGDGRSVRHKIFVKESHGAATHISDLAGVEVMGSGVVEVVGVDPPRNQLNPLHRGARVEQSRFEGKVLAGHDLQIRITVTEQHRCG